MIDNGIGMNRDDLVDNLGTIARSGTQRFVEQLSGDNASDLNLIGQFGVGFYSAFMVAGQVEVISRKAGEEHAWRWQSDGRSGYTIEAADAAPRGTSVILHLREDAKEFLDEWRLRQIVRNYSDHIAVPILLKGAPRAPDAAKDEGATDDGAAKDPEQINQASALWTRSKSDITDEQYKEFYHHVAHAFDEPWARLHVKAEGVVSYQALLFVPGSKPFDLYDPQRRHGVKLYVRRVFITEDMEGLMPRYLRFVRGVVDSEDLQLNVSRETLQHSPVLAKIKQGSGQARARRAGTAGQGGGRRLRGFLGELRIGSQGGHVRGPRATRASARARPLPQHRERRLGQPCRVRRAHEARPGRDLHDQRRAHRGATLEPAARSLPRQGRGGAAAGRSDRRFLAADHVDVPGQALPLADPRATSISPRSRARRQTARRPSAEQEAVPGAEMDRLIALFKTQLGERVKDVRPSARLTDSAVCLVADEQSLDMRLERFLKLHQQLDELSKRVLEINPKHALIRRMAALGGGCRPARALGDLVELLLDQARIVEGEPLPDPGVFSRRMSAFLAKGLAA